MLFDAEPFMNLKLTVTRHNYRDVKDVISSLDVTKLDIGLTELPPDFSFFINPYSRNRRGVWTRIFHKVPVEEEQGNKPGLRDGYNHENDGASLNAIGAIIAGLVRAALWLPSRVVYSTLAHFIIMLTVARRLESGTTNTGSIGENNRGP